MFPDYFYCNKQKVSNTQSKSGQNTEMNFIIC